VRERKGTHTRGAWRGEVWLLPTAIDRDEQQAASERPLAAAHQNDGIGEGGVWASNGDFGVPLRTLPESFIWY